MLACQGSVRALLVCSRNSAILRLLHIGLRSSQPSGTLEGKRICQNVRRAKQGIGIRIGNEKCGSYLLGDSAECLSGESISQTDIRGSGAMVNRVTTNNASISERNAL